jgi:hypothetical protein
MKISTSRKGFIHCIKHFYDITYLKILTIRKYLHLQIPLSKHVHLYNKGIVNTGKAALPPYYLLSYIESVIILSLDTKHLPSLADKCRANFWHKSLDFLAKLVSNVKTVIENIL